jgi:hypothetical protein
MEYVQFPSDQQIYDAGLSRAGYKLAYQTQQRTRKLEAQRQANTVQGVERHGSRFYEGGTPVTKLKAWQEQQRANAPVEAPVVAQQKTVQLPPKRMDDLARQSYQAYFDTGKNGTEQGKALHDFGVSQGICRSTACGFESESEVNATVTAIQSEAASLKYGFDRDGSLQARAAASRVVSSRN